MWTQQKQELNFRACHNSMPVVLQKADIVNSAQGGRSIRYVSTEISSGMFGDNLHDNLKTVIA